MAPQQRQLLLDSLEFAIGHLPIVMDLGSRELTLDCSWLTFKEVAAQKFVGEGDAEQEAATKTGGGQAHLHVLTSMAIMGRAIAEAVATGSAGGIDDEGPCIPNAPSLFPLLPYPTVFSDSHVADGVSTCFLLSPLPSPQPNLCPFVISDTQELEPAQSEETEEEDSDDEEAPSRHLTLTATSSETDTVLTSEARIEEGSARDETPGTSAQEPGREDWILLQEGEVTH
ncbi:uncharacterized protein [Heptranchias perlo]|uniref:uncharacterized protein isoform X2 n=1 Tax=Heptranchias perlo TaxID=212740 RepID=UPI00355982FB